MDYTDFPRFKRDINTNARALDQSLSFMQSKDTSLHLLDTPLISAFILPFHPSHGDSVDLRNVIDPDEDVRNIGNAILSLYSDIHSQSPFKIVVSDPTLLELQHGLEVIEARFERNANRIIKDENLYDSLMSYLNSDDFEFIDVPKQLQRDIQELIDTVPLEERTGNQIAFQNLCSQGAITGLGQWFSKEEYKQKRDAIIELCGQIVAYFYLHRRRKDGESDIAFKRRNRFDAANFAIATHLNKARRDCNVHLVAPFPAYLDQKTDFKSIFRSRIMPQSLVFTLRALAEFSNEAGQSKRLKAHKEAHDKILIAKGRAVNLAEYLKDIDTVTDLSDVMKEDLLLFYQEVLSELRVGVVQRITREQARQKAREILTSKDAFRNRFQSAAKVTSETVRNLSNITPVADSEELIVGFNWDDDIHLTRSVRKGP